MATTIPTLSAAELRARLAELVDLGEAVVVAESQLRAKARDLATHDWDVNRFVNEIAGGLAGIREVLLTNDPADGLAMDDVMERLEDVLATVDLAIAKGDDDAE